MDVNEVSNAKYAEFLNVCGNQVEEGKAWMDLSAPHALIEEFNGCYRAKPGFERYPVVMVSWYGARAYAAWTGKRLPSEAEREKAGRGGLEGNIYPWGDDPPTGQCNWCGYTGPHAPLRPDFYHGHGPLPVGLFPSNGFGLYDMSGNVWEWCQDWYAPDAYRAGIAYSQKGMSVDPSGPESGKAKVLRGGSWSFDPTNLRVANRSYTDPRYGYSFDGFRCVISLSDLIMKDSRLYWFPFYRHHNQQGNSSRMTAAVFDHCNYPVSGS